jgi:hypothetical protein
MLTPLHSRRLHYDEYFRFHPLHATYALMAVIVLVGLLAWFVTTFQQ